MQAIFYTLFFKFGYAIGSNAFPCLESFLVVNRESTDLLVYRISMVTSENKRNKELNKICGKM